MRALIADDHSIIRMALKYMLREIDPQADIVETAAGGDAERVLQDGTFDLVVTDLFMPGGGTPGVAALVRAAGAAPVVVFTVSENPSDVRDSMEAGARAYIPKTTDDPLIVNILRLVLAGGIYVPPQLTGFNRAPAALRSDAAAPVGDVAEDGGIALAERPPATAAVPTLRLPPLTRRQQQVLELLAQGMSNAEIGERLGLNLSTVKSHVTGVLRALNVVSRTQAVLAFKQSDWARRS